VNEAVHRRIVARPCRAVSTIWIACLSELDPVCACEVAASSVVAAEVIDAEDCARQGSPNDGE